ncbi:hypothetical protein [Phenylobacterium sp.]|uniref:hypothetical protein n=1 Tax=Phenylobacterium sp. TaxID=1871053 RepID=UPI0035AD7A0C
MNAPRPAISVQFASPEWVALLRVTLRELHAQARPFLGGVDFSIREEFTQVPPDGSTCVWAARILPDRIEFLEGAVRADYEVVGDYEAVLPGAKLIYEGVTDAELAAQAAHRKAMTEAGRLRTTGDIAAAPRSVRRMLQTMHDVLARQTV